MSHILKTPEVTEIFKYFELLEPQSIYAHAPVYKAQYRGQDVVLKQTRSSPEGASAVQRWIESLPRNQTVQALRMAVPNPCRFGADFWVVYPYVVGETYAGTEKQIQAAGKLLGMMHRDPQDFGLPNYDWPQQEPDSLAKDQQGLLQLAATQELTLAPELLNWLKIHQSLSTTLIQAHLPAAAGTWDYKANNLVYRQEAGQPAVLIDPDSAGFLPRILDLALAVLLFHNELPSAPSRLWTPSEWQIFANAYTDKCPITAQERKLWPQALKWMFLEEGLWLLLNDDGGWHDPHQRAFLTDLLTLPQHEHLFVFPGQK